MACPAMIQWPVTLCFLAASKITKASRGPGITAPLSPTMKPSRKSAGPSSMAYPRHKLFNNIFVFYRFYLGLGFHCWAFDG